MVESQSAKFYHSASTLFEAGRRVAALALVDTSLALPARARPVADAALEALRLQPSNGTEFMYYRPSSAPKALLILCHPSDGPSLCRSLADAWQERLGAAGLVVQREDLRDGAELTLGSAEALGSALTGKDPEGRLSPEVRRLQGLVEECQFLIFVHPVFWFEVPSQLKGFQESVLSSGFAFRQLPEHWVLNRVAGVASHLPLVPRLMRRYAAYGLLRDKRVFVMRTMNGPEAGLGIFDHGATSLESALQFCGARLAAVDTLAEIGGKSVDDITQRVLPKTYVQIDTHCRTIAKIASAQTLSSAVTGERKVEQDTSIAVSP